MLSIVRSPKMRSLSDAINWCVMGQNDIIVTKCADLFSVIRYRPPDKASSSPEQLLAGRMALNRAILRYGRRWGLWFSADRFETTTYDEAEWPDPISRLIDEKRKSLFTTTNTQFSTDHHICILYSPQDWETGSLAAKFEHANAEERTDEKRIDAELEKFTRGRDDLMKHLKSFMPESRLLEGSELLEHLYTTINTKRRKVKLDPFPLWVSEYLAETEFLGGRKPMLGDHHLRTIKIKGLPSETAPGVFDELNALPFPYRRVARWIPFDREDAQKELEARKKAWAEKRVPLLRKIVSRYFSDDGSRDNEDAKHRMEMADAALMALASSDYNFGLWTHTVTVSHPDIDVLNERIKQIQLILESKGFGAPVATDDAMSVWIGNLPGHPHGDLGRFVGCSLSFADILPATAVWEGPKKDYHLDGPPLLRGISEGGIPFRMCLHRPGSDVGHSLIIGATGAGKSTLIAAMVAGHRKYPDSRVIIIDRGASARCITLALGGEFHSLAADDAAVSLQPLWKITPNDQNELAWAFEWIVSCLIGEGLNPSPSQKREITLALEILATRPNHMKTLTVLRALIQDDDVKLAISPFCLGGAHGDLLDNSEMRLGERSDVTCFETATLLERPSAVGPVLSVVFHEIERGFDGRPTELFVDEAGTALDHPHISGKLREWLKQARKKNVAVILATQSLIDIDQSSIKEVISESCPTRIYTANPAALERNSASILANFGLSKEQIKIIAQLSPKREYVFTNQDGWRRFELCFSDLELAFFGRNSPVDQKAMDRVLAQGPKNDFARRWLIHCSIKPDGLPEQQIFMQAAE